MNTDHTSVKVCGMRDHENIRAVAACGPDFMGFIFYPGSPRFVGSRFSIPDDFPNDVERVGVFVQEPTENMISLSRVHALGTIQLHGGEPMQQCMELKQQGLSVIKVFSVGEEFDFEVLNEFVPVVDYFLFDTKSSTYGGSGKTFNWSLLDNYTLDVPFFLSGGLTPANYKNALDLKSKHLIGLDFNSGLEISPGIKNVVAVREVINDLLK